MRKTGIAVALLLFSLQSAATTLVWTIENAVFFDNTTLTGSFTYNSESGLISDLLIQTQPGIVQGATYTTEDIDAFYNNINLGLSIDDDENLPFGMALTLFFDSPLPEEGGVVTLNALESRFLKFPWRELSTDAYIVSSPVPIPGALILMFSALGVLARRRKQSVQIA